MNSLVLCLQPYLALKCVLLLCLDIFGLNKILKQEAFLLDGMAPVR